MLYEDFNAKRRTDGEGVFISRVSDEIVQNLNPKFELREYQKETLAGIIQNPQEDFVQRKF